MINEKTRVLFVIGIIILIWLLTRPVVTPLPPSQEAVVQTNTPNPDAPISQVPSSNASPSGIIPYAQARAEGIKKEQDQEKDLWQSPLLYCGRVIDESNQPISGVRVSYNASALTESGKEIHNTGAVTSDMRGIFIIDGVKGVGLMLQLVHSNYYAYPENSTGFDKRSLPQKGFFSDSEERAELFRMHSKGHPVSLIHHVGGMNVPMDGIPKTLDLLGADNQKIGQLVVKASGTPPPRYNQQPFDWGAEISALGGGLAEYTNYFAFVAPDDGYQESVNFTFPKKTVGWTDTVSKNYFVKLPLGYVRLNIYIGAKNPLFFSVEYDYNPDGSTELERAR